MVATVLGPTASPLLGARFDPEVRAAQSISSRSVKPSSRRRPLSGADWGRSRGRISPWECCAHRRSHAPRAGCERSTDRAGFRDLKERMKSYGQRHALGAQIGDSRSNFETRWPSCSHLVLMGKRPLRHQVRILPNSSRLVTCADFASAATSVTFHNGELTSSPWRGILPRTLPTFHVGTCNTCRSPRIRFVSRSAQAPGNGMPLGFGDARTKYFFRVPSSPMPDLPSTHDRDLHAARSVSQPKRSRRVPSDVRSRCSFAQKRQLTIVTHIRRQFGRYSCGPDYYSGRWTCAKMRYDEVHGISTRRNLLRAVGPRLTG